MDWDGLSMQRLLPFFLSNLVMVDSAAEVIAAMGRGEVSAKSVEDEYVNGVYEEIAGHFSATRHTPWPRIAAFMESIPAGSLTADVGCGNGKYLPLNAGRSFNIGSDRSANLVSICRGRGGLESLVADNLVLPFRSAAFDCAISIAVIHHFSSPHRRLLAVTELCRIVRPGGRILIYVWALEQDSKKFKEPDNFVSWTLQPQFAAASSSPSAPSSSSSSGANKKAAKKTRKSKTADDATSLHSQRQQEQQHQQKQQGSSSSSSTPTQLPENKRGEPGGEEPRPSSEPVVYQRFYHVFRKGELEELLQESGMATIVDSGYDHENWFVVAQRL